MIEECVESHMIEVKMIQLSGILCVSNMFLWTINKFINKMLRCTYFANQIKKKKKIGTLIK